MFQSCGSEDKHSSIEADFRSKCEQSLLRGWDSARNGYGEAKKLAGILSSLMGDRF